VAIILVVGDITIIEEEATMAVAVGDTFLAVVEEDGLLEWVAILQLDEVVAAAVAMEEIMVIFWIEIETMITMLILVSEVMLTWQVPSQAIRTSGDP
jgi:hypothetical protein